MTFSSLRFSNDFETQPEVTFVFTKNELYINVNAVLTINTEK